MTAKMVRMEGHKKDKYVMITIRTGRRWWKKENSRQNKLTCRKEKVDLRDFFVVEILEQIKMQYIMSVSKKLTIINSLSLSYQWHIP